MLRKVTRKDLRENTIKVSYCALQYLLNYQTPVGYNCGVYGHNYDYYIVHGLGISTGYRPVGKDVDYRLIKEYDDKAREALSRRDVDEVTRLVSEFVDRVKGE